MLAWLQELPRAWPRMLTNTGSLFFVFLLSTGNFSVIFDTRCKLFGAGTLLLFSICTALSKVGTGSTTLHCKQHQHHSRKRKKKSKLSSTTCTELVEFNPMEWREGKAFASDERHIHIQARVYSHQGANHTTDINPSLDKALYTERGKNTVQGHGRQLHTLL